MGIRAVVRLEGWQVGDGRGSRAAVRRAGADGAVVPDDQHRAGVVTRRYRLQGDIGVGIRVPVGLQRRYPQGRADSAGHQLGGPHAHLVIAVGDVQQHRVGGRIGQGILLDVVHVAAGLGAVPQHLGHGEQEGLVLDAGIAAAVLAGAAAGEEQAVGLEIDTAAQQHAVGHAGHAQHTAGDILDHAHEGATEYPALAVAVVIDVAVVEHRHTAGLEGGVTAQAVLVLEQARQVHEVQQALLLAVEERRHQREVLQNLQGEAYVFRGKAAPVSAAEHHLVIIAHDDDVGARTAQRLGATAQQAVAVQGGPGNSLGLCLEILGHGAGDAAVKLRGEQVVTAQAVRQAVIGSSVVERRTRFTVVRGQVVGDLESSGDGARPVIVLAVLTAALGAGREIDHFLHGEGRCRVAQAGKRVIANVQDALGDVPDTGYAEIPGQVQIIALYAGIGQGAENVLHGFPAALDGLVVRQGVIAESAEHFRRFQQFPRGVAHIAQGHDVARAALELHHGADNKGLLGRVIGVGIQLGKDQVLLTGGGVDDDHGRSGIQRLLQVGDRRRPGLLQVDARHLGHDHLRGRKAVVAVPLGGVDLHPLLVGRQGRLVEVHLQARVGIFGRHGKHVAGPGEHAVAGVQDFTAVGIGRFNTDRHRVGVRLGVLVVVVIVVVRAGGQQRGQGQGQQLTGCKTHCGRFLL